MNKRPKSYYLNLVLGLLALVYPLSYIGGVKNDSSMLMGAAVVALLASAVVVVFC